MTEVSKEWNERKFKCLESQISDRSREVEEKSGLLKKSGNELRDERRRNKELEMLLGEKEELLKRYEKEIKDQGRQDKELQREIKEQREKNIKLEQKK